MQITLIKKFMFSKKRIIHALAYELILLVLIALSLSFLFHEPLTTMGFLGLAMAITSVIWNMIFNHFFEKTEHKYNIKRTFIVRLFHAIGFEGGLMIATIPMVAYAMNVNLWNAFLIDLSMTLSILVYTFIFQYCYDKIEAAHQKSKTR